VNAARTDLADAEFCSVSPEFVPDIALEYRAEQPA